MKLKGKISKLLIAVMTLSMLTGCGAKSDKNKIKLDPDNPVSLTVWHYYNGAQQATFDSLVEEFNSTVGKDEGIYVEGYSQGSVSDLEQAISDALDGKLGAGELPDIFSSYADTAYEVQKQDKLVDLTQYFTDDELSKYVDSYIDEGYFNDDGALYLLPVAKSTEIMMINKTAWEPFAEATGTTIDELATVEGVVDVAERYYNWTDSLTPDIPDDGKAFYGRDSIPNYFIIGMKQMGTELFEVSDGEVEINADKELIRRLWDNYYVPYVKGYFASCGKFRSDDVKTGDIIAYTGSTSSTLYFPDSVETDDGSEAIDYIVCETPIMAGGENIKVQQGAGMAVTKSDKEHEYAASVFLKWFTEKENNLQFVCDSGYMPVLKEANSIAELDAVMEEYNLDINDKTYDCLTEVLNNFDNTTFYTTKNFRNGYSVRNVLNYVLSDKAAEDKAAIDEAVSEGQIREEAVAPYITDDAFDTWYEYFCSELEAAAE